MYNEYSFLSMISANMGKIHYLLRQTMGTVSIHYAVVQSIVSCIIVAALAKVTVAFAKRRK